MKLVIIGYLISYSLINSNEFFKLFFEGYFVYIKYLKKGYSFSEYNSGLKYSSIIHFIESNLILFISLLISIYLFL